MAELFLKVEVRCKRLALRGSTGLRNKAAQFRTATMLRFPLSYSVADSHK